jgi:hypothetical protein
VLTVGDDGVLADVKAEKERVEALTSFEDTPIVVRGLRKIFPAMDGGKPKVGPTA